MNLLQRNLEEIQSNIRTACTRSGRAVEDVQLVAVSKGHSADAIKVLYDLGIRDFGESYVPEWLEKRERLPDDIRWHFIGRLQSNKARQVVDRVVLVHSVDRESLVKQLNRRASRTVDALLQVNVAAEHTKGGVEPHEVFEFIDHLQNFSMLRLRGLMTMPPYHDNPEQSRPYFKELKGYFDRIHQRLALQSEQRASDFQELSMGMSHDYSVAIEEGATIIRVGTALFGERHN